jgi:hypothetical protein
MDRNGSELPGARTPIGSMERVATAFAAAAGDFWSRCWEAGTRRLVSALVDPFAAAKALPDCPSGAGVLLRQYGEWLGEMALAAGLAAQTFQRQVAGRPEMALLFCAASEIRNGPADLPQLDLLLRVSREGAGTLAGKVSENLKGHLAEYDLQILADCISGLERAISGTGVDVEHVSRLMSELAQALESKQTELPPLWDALGKALGTDHPELTRAVERLAEVLGATAMPSVLNPQLLHRFLNAIGVNSDIEVPADLRQQLDLAFQSAGIELSDAVSIRSGNRDWVIRDHGKDQAFRVLREGRRLDVYGRAEGKVYRVAGARVLLPARVHDASQGFALYTAPKETVQDLLDLHQPRRLQAWEVGSGTTPVAIFVVDYRDSDLGTYRELGIACFAAPKNSPLAVGMHILELPVTDQFSCEAGRDIWGYPKTLYYLDFTYRDGGLTSVLSKRGPPAQELFTLTLPRGGTGSSRGVPIYNYTVKRGVHHRTVFTRSGQGEGIQRGGRAVRLEVHTNVADPVLNTLQYLGLPGRTPLFSSWTERMSGEFGAPSVLTPLA